MFFSKNTFLRNKIFVAIVLLNLLFMTLMAAFNFYRDAIKLSISKKHELAETENKVQETFAYLLNKGDFGNDNVQNNKILTDKIFEIALHNESFYNKLMSKYTYEANELFSQSSA